MPFVVTPAELLNAARECRTTNEQVQGQIQQMRSLIDSIRASYVGPASLQLQSLSELWGSSARELNVVLTTIAEGLTSNANNYVEGESANLTNYTNIASTLPAARF